MTTYIYFVKCPGCEDEHFDFFDEAKEFALGCLSQKPIITQTEVCRNDFGECTDSADLGTVWSWEDMMKDTESKVDDSCSHVLCKADLEDVDSEFDDLDNSVDFNPEISDEGLEEWINPSSSQGPYVIKVKNNADGYNYEGNGGRSLVRIDSNALSVFNSYDAAMKAKMSYKNPKSVEIVLLADEQKLVECRKPIPEGMTIEQLVEEMEENEDTVECTWCEDLFDKSECRYEVDLGWLCSRCEMAIKSRGETLTFREGNYWDFLEEGLENEYSEEEIEVIASELATDIEDLLQDCPIVNDTLIESDKQSLVSSWIERVKDWFNDKVLNLFIKNDYLWERTFEQATMGWQVRGALLELIKVLQQSHFDQIEYVAKAQAAEKGIATEGLALKVSNKDYFYRDEVLVNRVLTSIREGKAKNIDEAVQQADIELFEFKLVSKEQFTEELEPKEIHDLGNEYDGGYPAEDPELPEIDGVSDSHLRLCPECGKNAFDTETGICVDCGFN